MTAAGCPICRASAGGIWIDDKNVFLFECEECSTFTITSERRTAFEEAWRTGDRDTIAYLEAVARYLRSAAEDDDRDVTADTWIGFAVEGQHIADAD